MPHAATTASLGSASAGRPRRGSVDIAPFDAPLGAEVIGLDLAHPLDDATFARIHQAHLDHHVLVFRDQRIDPQQQIDFSKRFGPLQHHKWRQRPGFVAVSGARARL